MAVITANTGSNNWNTNGAWVGGVQPSATSDVVIPASAVVTIPTATTVLGRSLTVQASGTLAFASTTAVLTLGDATAGTGNVALSVSTTATITLTGVGTINFNSTSATQQTVTSGGKTLPNMTFGGAGSSYILGDALTSTGQLTTNAGTFSTGNFAMNLSVLNYGNASTRTLSLGSSAISLTFSGSAFLGSGVGGLTISSNTAVITLTQNAPGANILILQGQNWQGASFVLNGGVASGSAAVIAPGGATVKNFTITGTAAKTNLYAFSGNMICTGTLTLNANSDANRMMITSSARGTARTLTAASVVVGNTVSFMDITGAGAATWTVAGTGAIYLGDAGGNSGITFTTPATQTATGTSSFTWSTHGWTTRVPLPQDDVSIPNSFSASRTVTVDMMYIGKSISFTCTGNPAVAFPAYTVSFFGSFTSAIGMTTSGTSVLEASGRSSCALTNNSVTMTPGLTINGPSGTYTLADAFTGTSTTTFRHKMGTFLTSNYSMSSSSFTFGTGNTGTVSTLGTSTFTSLAAGGVTVLNINPTGLTLSASSATILVTSSASAKTVQLTGATWGTITYNNSGSAGAMVFNTSGTLAALNFSDSSNARTLSLTSGITLTIPGAGWNVSGTSGKLMTVTSGTGGSAATISFTGRYGSSNYLSVKDITAITNSLYAGANSTNVSGNTNVIFTTPPVLGNFFEVF